MRTFLLSHVFLVSMSEVNFVSKTVYHILTYLDIHLLFHLRQRGGFLVGSQ